MYAGANKGHNEVVAAGCDKDKAVTGCDINAAQVNGDILLFTTAYRVHEGVVCQLLEAGCDKNQVIDLGATPLFATAQVVRVAIVPADYDKKRTLGVPWNNQIYKIII